MSRPSDQIKNVRSYVVHEDSVRGIHIKASHWEVGYTKAHQPTPEAAVEFQIANQAVVIKAAEIRLELLMALADKIAEDRSEQARLEKENNSARSN
jgi:hypothetical protein